ncbi:MAG: type I DNA topoisomerase [Pseudomonadota bacterium]
MPESLLIVESPTKARTLTKYLGKEFKIIASMGHIKDLPKTKMGVDIENGFKPEYRVIEGKKKIIAKIKKAAKDSVAIYLAPDPDREGEAIAWHIAEEIGNDHGEIYRVLFNEITEKGIQEGLKQVQKLDESKYESQQARRILDRLVGYELSPLLWKKVKRGLSAGRVQSVALRIIVDREKEIFVFKPTEYWKIFCDLERSDGSGGLFRTQVTHRNGEKLELSGAAGAQQARDHLDVSAFSVQSIKKQKRRRNPPAPFITSRLQQEATRKLWMSAKKVMQVAQQLYEGVEIGNEGAVGLITYMRTDSTRMSVDAVAECRGFIAKAFGPEYLPESPRVYPQKKSAQGAHEAIRPTSMSYPPEKIRQYLSEEQLKLYSMIWRRYVACQMNPAVYNETKVIVEANPPGDAGTTYTLSAVGSSIEFEGWLAAEPESRPVAKKKKKDEENGEGDGDDEKGEEEDGPVMLPELSANDLLRLAGEKVIPQQKFTKPPPRFTEGSLVKELEDKGIGRPSTYASIISTIAGRQYVRKFKYRLYPTALGEIVVVRLVKHFPEVLDVEFTARMEESLDRIESKTAKGIDILENFYGPFHKNIEDALKTMKAGIDPDEYKNSCAQSASGGVFAPLEVETPCPKCGKKMILKSGRFGFFLSCRDYPKCRESLPPYSGVKCPLPGCDGEVVEIKLKNKGNARGKRNFYGCSKYNDNGCKFTIWDTPLLKECSKCGSTLMVIKKEKGGAMLVCRNEECKHGEDIPY